MNLDFIPVLGYLDDVIILPLMVAGTIKLVPKEIMKQCRIEFEELWRDGKPKKWYNFILLFDKRQFKKTEILAIIRVKY